MSTPFFENPSGVIDGINTVFTLTHVYIVGSTAVFLNGLLLNKELENGWEETSPSSRIITMNIAPEIDDILTVYYLYSNPAEDTSRNISVIGILVASDVIAGNISKSPSLIGSISSPSEIIGILN